MKKKLSLSGLLHNDKLMMALSAILAIVIWAVVVYGPSNSEERVITGVPVSITLNDYASQTLNLRIVKGAEATATVKVEGLRSVVGALTPQDITVTADTGNVISEGTYTLPLRAVSSGDYSIVSVVGTDGNNDTVTVTCDSWREVAFPVTVEMSGLQVTDTEKFQFGTPSVSGDTIAEGKITVSGPRTDMNRIDKVVATIEEEKTISEATAFEATLSARDEEGKVIESVAFLGAEDSKVNVTVPVMVYRKVELKPQSLHIPAGYADKKDLVSVSPTSVELWGVPSEIDEYIEGIREQLQVDFDALTADTLERKITLEAVEGIRPLNGSEIITVKVNLSNIKKKVLDVPLSKKNLKTANAPAGWTATPSQTKLTAVQLYGPAAVIAKLKAEDIVVTVDMTAITVVGNQTVKARLSVKGENRVWAVYDPDMDGVDVLVSVTDTKKTTTSKKAK